MRIDVHLHYDQPSSVTRLLDTILTRLESLMSTVNDVKQLVSDLNDETNTVAAKIDAQAAAIQALKDQIAAGTPVSQADLDAIGSGLTAVSDRLKTLGADTSNPIPPPV